jgi:hypothetical protein
MCFCEFVYIHVVLLFWYCICFLLLLDNMAKVFAYKVCENVSGFLL